MQWYREFLGLVSLFSKAAYEKLKGETKCLTRNFMWEISLIHLMMQN